MKHDTRIQKLLKAAAIIKKQTDKDVDLTALVAMSMQTGYQIGKLESKSA